MSAQNQCIVQDKGSIEKRRYPEKCSYFSTMMWLQKLGMSTHDMFLWRNNKNYQKFLVKKSTLSEAMNLYFLWTTGENYSRIIIKYMYSSLTPYLI